MRYRLGSYLRRHWRGIVNIITVAALAGLVYALRNQIFETLRRLDDVNYWWLLLMLPLQALNHDQYARMYRRILDFLDQKVEYRSMYRVSLELNFVNHVFPSGGITGISYFGLRLRDYGVKGSTSTIIQLVKFVMLFLSFQILIAIGLLAIAIGGKSNNLVLLIAGVLATMTLTGTFAMAYVIGSKSRINAFFTALTKLLNRLIHVVRPGHPETINISRLRGSLDNMHDNYRLLQGNLPLLKRIFLYALVANICEIMTIYVVYIAFGELVNIGAVIIAYAIANFAGLISVLPGGVGIYEALMTAGLAAGGVRAGLSLPVTVMYRILSMTIQLTPGWILYHRALSRGEK